MGGDGAVVFDGLVGVDGCRKPLNPKPRYFWFNHPSMFRKSYTSFVVP